MPYISIESGKLTAEQKKQLIERLTATASEITHIPEQFFTVTIKELPDEKFFAMQSAKAMMASEANQSAR
ncbi:tautomerase family protein [Paramuribaculum intestinale]|jgi:4-oxalocrotonate tautomerase|uniref:4-oxalocrotonate tautomerase DmpI n=1 Tax=Muribaculaceae TaxID=2005473 RepID=UPI001F0BDDB2|nr:4-oxalocrotonate tautomerase DmpI [Paramuribaculum intestinale]WLT42100.1 tautomerase family protein [Paramuribaculum intestinale]